MFNVSVAVAAVVDAAVVANDALNAFVAAVVLFAQPFEATTICEP